MPLNVTLGQLSFMAYERPVLKYRVQHMTHEKGHLFLKLNNLKIDSLNSVKKIVFYSHLKISEV